MTKRYALQPAFSHWTATFLAHDLEIETVSLKDRRHKIHAQIDWDTLVKAEDLTKAKVAYEQVAASGSPFEQGTRLILKRLKHTWTMEEIRGLAKEIWWLQPPFRSPEALRGDEQHRFYVEFVSTQDDAKTSFDQQMRAILGIWMARLVGKNEKGQVDLSLEFAGQYEPITHRYRLADFQHNHGRFDGKLNLNGGDFEIRIYKLQYKQPQGIAVEEAREYFRIYGGVHVYDSGFHLPYYGNVENDWLRVQLDHARRISKSDLLPESLQVDKGLTFLPTLSRVFGVVNVNTAREPKLEILVTRDRLRESTAFEDLVNMVRYALDFYAQHEARRAFQKAQSNKPIEPTVREVEVLADVLERHEDDIPKPVYNELQQGIRHAAEAARETEATTRAQIGVLGPLATAGISALAYQHEIQKQFVVVEGIVTTIRGVKTKDRELMQVLEKLSADLTNWLDRAMATNALFDYFADADNVQLRRRFRALTVVQDVIKQMRFLARGADVTTDGIDPGLILPLGSLAEWGAIFQNVLSNAFAATLDSEERRVRFSSCDKGKNKEILVQDTGSGVDLRHADKLFEPFQRKLKISPERRALGYGGMGLGLAIVKLLADHIGCKVGFVEPENGFSTAFSLSWKEKS